MTEQIDFDPWMEIHSAGYKFSTRLKNCLGYIHCQYIGQLVVYTEADLLKLPNFGKKSLIEVKAFLACVGACPGMELGELKDFRKAKDMLKSCTPCILNERYTIFPHGHGDVSRIHLDGALRRLPLHWASVLSAKGFDTLGQIALAPREEIEALFSGDQEAFEILGIILKYKHLELGTALHPGLMRIKPYCKRQ